MVTAAHRNIRSRRSARPIPSVNWEEVLANLSDAVLLFGTDGAVVACNPAAEQLLGLSQAQILGRCHQSLFAGSPVIARLLRRAAGAMQTQTEAAGSLTRRDGCVPVRVATSPLLDSNGRGRGTAVVIHDLRYEHSLEEDARRAEELVRLGTVAAGLAHEIKNPLGGIKGAAQLLRRQAAEPAAVREYADLIIRETERLSGLVEQLFGLRPVAPPHFAPLNVHRLIQEVLSLAQQSPAAGGITVRSEFDPSLPPVRGDERQLKQVLFNLIGNAFDAMESSGTLTLTTRMATDFRIVRPQRGDAKLVRIEVVDTGAGIAPENLARIFDPFFTTKSRGIGLGLAISHRIVSAHDGSLQAASQPGKGTVMTLTLPVARG